MSQACLGGLGGGGAALVDAAEGSKQEVEEERLHGPAQPPSPWPPASAGRPLEPQGLALGEPAIALEQPQGRERAPDPPDPSRPRCHGFGQVSGRSSSRISQREAGGATISEAHAAGCLPAGFAGDSGAVKHYTPKWGGYIVV